LLSVEGGPKNKSAAVSAALGAVWRLSLSCRSSGHAAALWLTDKQGEPAKKADDEDESNDHGSSHERNFIRERGCSAYDTGKSLSRAREISEGKYPMGDKVARTHDLTNSPQCIIMRT
jgi:hypothetical protein